MGVIRKYWKRGWAALLCAAGLLLAFAQEGEFDPVNPPEPQVMYRVKVTAQPEEAAYVSGTGTYVIGSTVYVGTSATSPAFRFSHWLKNGEEYAASEYFTFNVADGDANFVAVYDYDPSNPSEPQLELRHRLMLECIPEGACSFNRTSGEKVKEGEMVYLRAYPSQGFEFQGWYCNGEKVGSNESLNIEMPTGDVTYYARYVFNPANPGEPQGGGQMDVETNQPGDVNGDKVVDVTDAVAVVNCYLGQGAVDQGLADVNGDGMVDVTDAVAVVNIYLKNE